MEFPHGHHHPHTHHHRRDEDDQNPPPPPPHHPLPPPSSYYEANETPPPPYPHAHQSSHVVDASPYPQAIGGFSNSPAAHNSYPPPQTAYPSSVSSSVHHVSHDLNPQTEYVTTSHPHRHHMPSFPHHTQSHHDQQPPQPSDLADKPAVRVFCKAEPNYSLTIREGKVILAPSNPSDPFQRWIKDEKYSTKVKDEEGFPSFALVNKATGQAMKHSIGATHPVQLVRYNPNALDESILWSLSKDLGDGHRTIRMVNNIRLNVDAFNGDKNHGGVHDGTTIVLWEWKKGDNQRWKIIPY